MSKGIDLEIKRVGFGCAHRYTENKTYRYININIAIRAYVYKKSIADTALQAKLNG